MWLGIFACVSPLGNLFECLHNILSLCPGCNLLESVLRTFADSLYLPSARTLLFISGMSQASLQPPVAFPTTEEELEDAITYYDALAKDARRKGKDDTGYEATKRLFVEKLDKLFPSKQEEQKAPAPAQGKSLLLLAYLCFDAGVVLMGLSSLLFCLHSRRPGRDIEGSPRGVGSARSTDACSSAPLSAPLSAR